MGEALEGVVKWFNDAKGFGFIEHGSGRDVFVHYSVIEAEGFKTLKDGERVQYEIKEGPKGLHAIKVSRKVEQAAADSLAATNVESSDAAPAEDSKTLQESVEIERIDAPSIAEEDEPFQKVYPFHQR